MVKQYNIKAGMVFAISIAMMATILPRLIRFDLDQPRTVLLNFIYLSMTFFFYWILHHFFLISTWPIFYSYKFTRPVVSVVCSIVIIAIITLFFNKASLLPVNIHPGVEIKRGQMVLVRLFRGFIISSFTYLAAYYFRMLLMLQQSTLENEYLKQGNLEAQLASLRQQISPHFLFNSLNTLSTLSHEEPVKEYILKMSEVYRYVLHYQEQKEVPVEKELEFIGSYVYILQSRFEEGLKINIRVGSENLSRKILPFALQLLVENVIKHNAISYTKPLLIEIYDLDGRLVVENDFRPRTRVAGRSGTGLYNLSQRYRLTANKEIRITQDISKFKVEIPFLP